MQSNTARAGLAAALIAAAVVLFVVVNKSGQPVGGIKELDYNQGDQVSFRVRSGVADEVHVHGYDLHKDVKAGGTVSFSFPASLTGIFEAELESRKQQIIELRVNP